MYLPDVLTALQRRAIDSPRNSNPSDCTRHNPATNCLLCRHICSVTRSLRRSRVSTIAYTEGGQQSKTKLSAEQRRPWPPSFMFPAGVPVSLPFPTNHQQQQTNTHPTSNAKPSTTNNVPQPTLPAPLAPKHRPLAKTTPTLAPPSPTRAIDRKHGRPRESDAHDGRAGAGYAGSGWVCGRDVSSCSGRW